MTSIFEQFSQWLSSRVNFSSDRGATAVEYGLMVALIAAVIIVAVAALGSQTNKTFDCTSKSIAARSDQCATP